MSVRDSLKKNQPIVWKTFANGLEKNTLSHAYLLSGEQGIPLLSYAKYLAKSLVCDDLNPLACEECLTCKRVESGNYGDLIIVDGSKATIKKDDIQKIESRFETTTIEKKQVGIYILNLVENMTTEAINSLLKFLEEPPEHLYAFLTTENQKRVLPTILSRAQILSFQRLDVKKVIEDALSLGVNEEDVELLCELCNDGDWVLERSKSKEYLDAKDAFLHTLLSLKEDVEEAHLDAHSYVLNKLSKKDKKEKKDNKVVLRLYFDLLIEAFEEAYRIKSGSETLWKSHYEELEALSKYPYLEDMIEEGMKIRSQIDFNVQVGLLIDHFFYVCKRGVRKHG